MCTDLVKARPRIIALWKRFDGRCFWCGQMTCVITADLPQTATKDHIYPKRVRRRGGKGSHAVVLSCRMCNGKRGATKARRWAAHMGVTLPLKKDGRIDL